MHVLRPLFVVVAVVGLILVARMVYVPQDFGVQEQGYMYGWHRKGNEEEWKKFPVKYHGPTYCRDCHAENAGLLAKSPHRSIGCENCHGPARDHPQDPPKLTPENTREFCLRCHAFLDYPTSGRRAIKGFADPEKHNPGMVCSLCHNPHDPKPGGSK